MGNAQPQVNKPSQAKFIIVRNFDGTVTVMEEKELHKLLAENK